MAVSIGGSHDHDSDRARQVGVLAVAREEALVGYLRETGPKEMLRLFSEEKGFVHELLNLTGARLLHERDANRAKEITDSFLPADSVVGEFKVALALYLASGAFPPTTEAVANELRLLPTSPKTGEHLLSTFTSERVALSRKRDYFERFIEPALERLRMIDMDLRASQSDNFQPSTDDSPEKREALDEADIMQRVEPFIGGYFREQVLDGVDWENMRVLASGVTSEKLNPPEAERVTSPQTKIHTFQGMDGAKLAVGEHTAPLPASARVYPETATAGLAIRRSVNGAHTLEWMGEGDPPETYNFQFERATEPSDWQRADPTESEQGVPSWVVETLSAETQSFLTQLQSARITDQARVRQIAVRIQKGIEYVNDSAVGTALAASGRQYFTTLEEVKKFDCDVANFYALAQIRALDIPCRMVVGYHAKRDKRFTFTALAGDKHAWLEWWNRESGLWERIDATPPAPPKEDEDEESDEGVGSEDRDMLLTERQDPNITPDETDDDPFGIPFGPEELERLKERLADLPDSDDEAVVVGRTFEDLYGISMERWEEVRRDAEAIGRMVLPKDATIDRRAESTVADEWKRTFDLLMIAYRLPSRSRRLIGRQSQGGVLTDPLSAGIDVLTGSEDPYGYEKRERREQTEKLPIRFSNDFLLDTTASMTAQNSEGVTLLELERQFVLSSVYAGYRLNERIKQRIAELANVPTITHHILSIHGGSKWQEVLKTAPAELKELAAIDESMRRPTRGAGGMAEALEHYVKTLEEDASTVAALANGDMLKTLTIMTDGNLWCAVCGQESCDYQLHGPTIKRVNKALSRARELGVVVNAIGFTEQSRPVAVLFAVEGDPEAAVVVETLGEALASHHRQTIRAMRPVIAAAQKKSGMTSTKLL